MPSGDRCAYSIEMFPHILTMELSYSPFLPFWPHGQSATSDVRDQVATADAGAAVKIVLCDEATLQSPPHRANAETSHRGCLGHGIESVVRFTDVLLAAGNAPRSRYIHHPLHPCFSYAGTRLPARERAPIGVSCSCRDQRYRCPTDHQEPHSLFFWTHRPARTHLSSRRHAK